MSRIKNSAGFSLHLVIAVVVGVALLGIIVWRVMDANSSDDNQSNGAVDNSQTEIVTETQSEAVETQEAIDPNEGYVVIEEWGVRFKPVDGLVGVEYGMPEDFSTDTITFTTKELSDLEPRCSIGSGRIIFGTLTRFNKNEEPTPSAGGTIAEIGDYRYQYRGPQAMCSNDRDLEGKAFMTLVQSIKSLEAAK